MAGGNAFIGDRKKGQQEAGYHLEAAGRPEPVTRQGCAHIT